MHGKARMMKLYIGPYDSIKVEAKDVFAEWHYIPQGCNAEYMENEIENNQYNYIDAQHYVARLCDRMISSACVELNEIHEVSFDYNEWKLYYGTWLYDILFSIYSSYKKIINYANTECVAIIPYNDEQFTRCDMVEAIVKIANDDFFHSNIYRQICTELGIPVEICADKKKNRSRERLHNFIHFPAIRKEYVSKLVSTKKESKSTEDIVLPLLHDKKIILFKMRFSDAVKTELLQNESICIIDENDIDKMQHLLLERGDFTPHKKIGIFDKLIPENEFERIAKNIISCNLPIELVEGFKVLNSYAEIYCSENSIKKIYSSAFVGQSCLASLIAIYMQRKGAVLYDVQHSAVYNINLGNRFCEQYVFGHFLTWGVKNENDDCNVKPVGITRLNYDVNPGGQERKKGILLCSNPIEKYECGRNMLFAEYAEKHTVFLETLYPEKRKKIVTRIFADDYKSPIYQLYLHRFYNIRVQNVRDKSFFDAIEKAELVVADSYGSTHIEAMAMNKPVIFFDGITMLVRDQEVDKLLAELHEKRIYAFSPQEAATFVNDISNVKEWWEAEDVQFVVQKYLDVCAHNYNNIAKTWKEEILI